LIRHRLRHVDHDDGFGADPHLTITVVGIDDVYRLARHLETGQCEFSKEGRAILRGLDRRSPGIVRRLVERMGPSRWGYPGVRPRVPKAAPR
jgi:hypothetical protein